MGFVDLAVLSIVASVTGLSLYAGGATVYGVALTSIIAVAVIFGCALNLHASIGEALFFCLFFIVVSQVIYVVSGLSFELAISQCASFSKCLRSRLGASRLDRDS